MSDLGSEVMLCYVTDATSFRLLDQLKEALSVSAQNPYEKHVNVLLNSSALCREVGGIICILCKSGMYVCMYMYVCRGGGGGASPMMLCDGCSYV